ncbi:hypothetical protein OO014_14945 [Intrasporangium calvum]|uniref:Uncharacterized protein n=1 Tax=Intrasporangium calvum TaxID=53358 RepID=A0ABT5GK09_9MICO|nr:hypothetical protein [Intrasporangium calvum]MDC5698554.1 hypothetical protein [Intrasporangium calvum]
MQQPTKRGVAVWAAAVLTAAGVPLAVPSVAGAAPECQVAALQMPAGAIGSGLMDIEQIDGQTVYYGNYYLPLADGGENQRAVIWRGLGGTPQEVGPLDAPENIAYELTATGLINGEAIYPDGTFRPWIQDIRTGALTWLKMPEGAAVDGNGGRIRRINDTGATVGVLATGKGSSKWNNDVVGHASPTAPIQFFGSPGRHADGWGINNSGQRVGYVQTRSLAKYPHWALWLPSIWEADGSLRYAAMPGTDAMLFTIEDDGRMSGMSWMGAPESGHFEPTHWADADHYETLGVLDGGGWGRPFGADGDTQVGWLDFVPEPGAVPDWALMDGWVANYGYFWRQGMVDGVRILPSLHNVASGDTDWHAFYGVGAVHAVHEGLDQAGTSTHAGFTEGQEPIFQATVFVNVSSCGVAVETTHDPWHLSDVESAVAYTEQHD